MEALLIVIKTYGLGIDREVSFIVSPSSDKAIDNVFSSTIVKLAGLPFTILPLIRIQPLTCLAEIVLAIYDMDAKGNIFSSIHLQSIFFPAVSLENHPPFYAYPSTIHGGNAFRLSVPNKSFCRTIFS